MFGARIGGLAGGRIWNDRYIRHSISIVGHHAEDT